MRIVVGALAAVLLVTGCSHIPGMGSKGAASPSAEAAGATPAGTPHAKATGGLDAEVAMPPGFPNDVPIYPGARLTAGAEFVSTGQVAFGMEWESPITTPKVWAFYEKEFAAGDWTITPTSDTNGVYAATIARKSNTNVKGILAVNNDTSVTVVALSLSSPS